MSVGFCLVLQGLQAASVSDVLAPIPTPTTFSAYGRRPSLLLPTTDMSNKPPALEQLLTNVTLFPASSSVLAATWPTQTRPIHLPGCSAP